MLLALSVIGPAGQALGSAAYKVFDARGGSIGRVDGNDWVLPDPERLVSSRHAWIRCVQGTFYLEDVSTNGTGVNAPQSVVARGQLHPLKEGDRLFVGDYEVLVQLMPEAVTPPPAPLPQPLPLMASAPAAAPAETPLAAAGGGALADLFRDDLPQAAPLLPPEPALQLPPPLPPLVPLVPPMRSATPAAQSPIPENWDLTSFSTPEPTPAAAAAAAPLMPVLPPLAAALPPAAGADVAALLGQLGLTAQQVPGDTLSKLGQILRVAVQGLMEVLVARKQVKDHFRMAMTIIRPVENNPLKFAATVDDAMYTLFVKRNAGYLGAVEAFGEAFDDLSFHELAMLAGMRAAFLATMARFDPAAIEADHQRAAGKKAGLFGAAKPAYWDSYRQHYEQMTHDSEVNFQQVFGEAFVRAYDDQIRKLQDARARRGKV